jgi:hypothetical protein
MFLVLPRRNWVAVATIGILLAAIAPTSAQVKPEGGQDNGGLNGSMSHADLERLYGEHKQDASTDTPRNTAAARAKAEEQAGKLLATLHLSCDISDALLVVSGTQRPTSGGREVDTRVYEVACGGKMGYLLEAQGTVTPIAISCLAAEEARAQDATKGRPPGFYCKLPENRDVYALLSALIATGAGAQCSVQRLQYFGRSESTQSEYSEVVCADGKGFLLRMALPGTGAENAVMSCDDAARQGLKCRLTEATPAAQSEAPVTSETFKTALAQHGVSCKIDQVRMIGQEDHRKRYVVEYRCADPPEGGVAFIPLQGNSNPYEALDCAAAVLEAIPCLLTPGK